jgi:hypothetical protein
VNVIHYVRRRGALECDRISHDESGEGIELRFEDSIFGAIKLGNCTKKIAGKSCLFDTGRLKDGIYRPKIYLSESLVEPEGFEISGGAIKLIPKDDDYIRALSREAEALRREITKIKETLSIFDEKINGHPIF